MTTDLFSCRAGTVKTLLGDGQTSTVAAIAAASVIGAPLLEEFTYRGFLLPSLTRWLPTPAAVSHTVYTFCLVRNIYYYRSCHSLLLFRMPADMCCSDSFMYMCNTEHDGVLTSTVLESGHWIHTTGCHHECLTSCHQPVDLLLGPHGIAHHSRLQVTQQVT